MVQKAILRHEARENHFTSDALQVDLIKKFEADLEMNFTSFRVEKDVFNFAFDYLIQATSSATLTQLFVLIRNTIKSLKSVSTEISSQLG